MVGSSNQEDRHQFQVLLSVKGGKGSDAEAHLRTKEASLFGFISLGLDS